jgi:lipopolysaccharide heptosyltransferase II
MQTERIYLPFVFSSIFDKIIKKEKKELSMTEIKNILIRLPNWLGDMVMATAFVQAVKTHYPNAAIDLITKKGIDFLLDYFPEHNKRFVFSKEQYKGLKGARLFGRGIRKQKKYDLFFCLPDSLSAATMGNAVWATKSIGFKKNLRFILLSNTFKKNKKLHRVEEYVDLLAQFMQKKIEVPAVVLQSEKINATDSLIININSEAVSRRLPKEKAISIIDNTRKKITNNIILVGSAAEAVLVNEVYELLFDKSNITNLAGKTTLTELIRLFAESKAVLSTDSGPAHISNALGKKTVVLFGAGNEYNTAPYNKENCVVVRLGKLACEPCVKNTCKVYGIPECLLQLDEDLITENIIKILV